MARVLDLVWLIPIIGGSLLGQVNDPTGGFTSRFIAHGVVSISGYGPAARAQVGSNCSGTGEADSQGRFSIPGSVNMSGNAYCEFKIVMSGCEGRVISVMVPGGSLDLGQIVLQPLRGRKGAGTVSFFALAAPPESANLKSRAAKSMKAGKFGEAQKDLEKAVKSYAKDVEALYLMGMSEKEQHKDVDALAHFKAAVALDGMYVPPRVQLAVYALREQNWAAVEGQASEVVSINPEDYPDAWLYLATARLMQGSYQSAELSARNAIESAGERGMPKAHHILGVALAKQGKAADGIAEMQIYLNKAPNASDAPIVKKQIESLGGSPGK